MDDVELIALWAVASVILGCVLFLAGYVLVVSGAPKFIVW